MVLRNTYAMTPYPAARRVKKVVNCIFVSLIVVILQTGRGRMFLSSCRDRGHHARINIAGHDRRRQASLWMARATGEGHDSVSVKYI